MEFEYVDLAHWARQEHYHHYLSQVPCTYSMTTRLDITPILQAGHSLYPAMLHCISKTVHMHAEFRMELDADGRLGYYKRLHPCYTVFHKDTETFSNLWTEYTPDYEAFCEAYRLDMAQYGRNPGMEAKPGTPENTFPVSMLPWASFEGFNLNLQKGYDYLLPIFTMGRYQETGGKTLLPLAVQVHHAVCDGFHLCRFVNGLQARLDGTQVHEEKEP